MTDTEIRILIAEACGWRCHRNLAIASTHLPTVHWSKPDGSPAHDWPVTGNGVGLLPDYPNDLNAMHEAEKVLTEEQRSDYVEIIASNISEEICDLDPRKAEWMLATMTARQRAEAFLRTLGKWKE